MHLSFKQCDVREIGAFQTAVFFFQLFDVEILAKFNKILEKSVEVTIVKEKLQNISNFFV
jgi:hypothetical protein